MPAATFSRMPYARRDRSEEPVDLEEVTVRADLDGTIAAVGDLEPRVGRPALGSIGASDRKYSPGIMRHRMG